MIVYALALYQSEYFFSLLAAKHANSAKGFMALLSHMLLTYVLLTLH
jgi:hypothetical protein